LTCAACTFASVGGGARLGELFFHLVALPFGIGQTHHHPVLLALCLAGLTVRRATGRE
jgi:hypothetical protein